MSLPSLNLAINSNNQNPESKSDVVVNNHINMSNCFEKKKRNVANSVNVTSSVNGANSLVEPDADYNAALVQREQKNQSLVVSNDDRMNAVVIGSKVLDSLISKTVESITNIIKNEQYSNHAKVFKICTELMLSLEKVKKLKTTKTTKKGSSKKSMFLVVMDTSIKQLEKNKVISTEVAQVLQSLCANFVELELDKVAELLQNTDCCCC